MANKWKEIGVSPGPRNRRDVLNTWEPAKEEGMGIRCSAVMREVMEVQRTKWGNLENFPSPGGDDVKKVQEGGGCG